MDQVIRQRRGSALLVVLGMLAFMVISAVAFSAYMRLSRLPSSFLRRTVASRMLVKAALAEAIDEIDNAIGDNPHPGVGTAGYKRSSSSKQLNRNWWKGRVYLGTNDIMTAGSSSESLKVLVEQYETVPTLTLEGLAYIPPPLVNEARYYSRHSAAGKWHTLPYDAGRYAFCAIDVSDYIDVNQVRANVARSSAPDSRISLAYIFEDEDHTSASGDLGQPDEWDDFMKNFQGNDKVPLVSVADWNLAINNYKPGQWWSPFCRYFEGDGYSPFYGTTEFSDPELASIRRMTFVADGWFPSDPDASLSGTAAKSATQPGQDTPIDLMEGENQPFRSGLIDRGGTPLNALRLISGGDSYLNSVGAWLRDNAIGPYGIAALYDYLDLDRTPSSLAMPTTERVPMICALQPVFAGMKLEVNETESKKMEPEGEEKDPAYLSRKLTITKVVTLKTSLSQATLNVVYAYPFRHADGLSPTFKLDGRVSFFFTTGGQTLSSRTGSASDVLHFSADPDLNDATVSNDGVMELPLQSQNISLPTEVKTEQDAVKSVMLRAGGASAIDSQLANKPLLTVVYEAEQKRTYDEETKSFTPWTPSEADICKGSTYITSAHTDLPSLKSDGTVDPTVKNDAALKQLIAGAEGVTYNLNAAVWVRIRISGDQWSDNDRTVDFVPACVGDDYLLAKGAYSKTDQTLESNILGAPFPLLKFGTGASLKISAQESKADAPQVTLAPSAIMVGDPRFNHNPESWFSCSSADENSWLSNCGAHETDRDGDIFMSVSDQGYLQSIYEFANLPRLTEFYRWNDGGTYGPTRGGSQYYGKVNARTEYAASLADSEFGSIMWKTYCPFQNKYTGVTTSSEGIAVGDDFLSMNIVSSGNGYKVNPYSDSLNVIMAALANAPHEWRLAGTNEDSSVIKGEVGNWQYGNAAAFNQKYAWNEYGSGAKLKWENLEDFAQELMEQISSAAKTAGSDDIETIFDEVWSDKLNWYQKGKDANYCQQYLLDDLQLSDTSDQGKLYMTDKKFLYGFWHDSFAVKQQLFLIFVRAEPSMMGGGAPNVTPPSLGGRAVALVWRDPRASKLSRDDTDVPVPHRTRILFYHQFD